MAEHQGSVHTMTGAQGRSAFTLTPPEVGVLVMLCGTPSPLEDALRIPRLSGFDDPMAITGVQSLVARDLATVAGESLNVDPVLGVVGLALGNVELSYTFAFESEHAVTAARIVDGVGFRLWLTPRVPALLNVQVIDPEPAPADVLDDLVHTFFDAPDARAVTIGVELADGAEGEGGGGVEVRRTAEGLFARTSADGGDGALIARPDLAMLLASLAGGRASLP